MSKLEMVKNLPSAKSTLAESLRQLQEISEELIILPQAISKEVAPLVELEQRVEEITQAQRLAISQTVEEITSTTYTRLAETANAVRVTVDQLENLAPLISELKQHTTGMTTAAQEVEMRVNKLKPQLWVKILTLILAGLIGGMSVGIGQKGFVWLMPPSETQKNSDLLMKLQSKAEPKEIDLMNEIINR